MNKSDLNTALFVFCEFIIAVIACFVFSILDRHRGIKNLGEEAKNWRIANGAVIAWFEKGMLLWIMIGALIYVTFINS